MTTANHSTNQQPHGLGNLGQINEGQGQEQFKVLTVAEIEALPEAEYLAYCKQAFAMPTTERTPAEVEANATEILKELNGHNAAPYRCVFCGSPSWYAPEDQTPPPNYCHESDHGTPDTEF